MKILNKNWKNRKPTNKVGFFMLKRYIKQIIIGFLAGLVSGFFSTGGGLILVPAFMYLLNVESQKARGTSVFCILPMVLTSSFFYYRGNFIDWKVAILCGIGGAIGGYIGAKLLKKLPEKILKIAFTIFLIYVSLKMIYK